MRKFIIVAILAGLLVAGCGYSVPDPQAPVGSKFYPVYYDYTNGIVAYINCGHSNLEGINHEDCIISIQVLGK